MCLLEARDLRKHYDTQLAVDGVSLRVSAGEILGLLGPNGAGKTTTMLMLAGLLTPDDGAVRIDGVATDHDGRAWRRQMGIVPQELALYPELSAVENLTFFGGLYDVVGPRLVDRIDSVLETTGLTEHRDRPVRTYSGGMKRRLNFGVALVHEPRLLILDEPTVGVDPQSRAHLLERIRELRDRGMGVLYASHYMEEVQTLCDRVAVMDLGRIIANDTLDALLERVTDASGPANLETLFLEMTGHRLRD
jgi:ABC-2 type transport system ATP-binding protein